MGFQNQPPVLVFTVVGFLAAWAGLQGRPASTPRLLAAGLAVTAATVFHQAAVLLAAPGCGALLLSERGSAGSRASVFELMARPRVVRAEDIHTVAASLIAMLRRETAGIVIG